MTSPTARFSRRFLVSTACLALAACSSSNGKSGGSDAGQDATRSDGGCGAFGSAECDSAAMEGGAPGMEGGSTTDGSSVTDGSSATDGGPQPSCAPMGTSCASLRCCSGSCVNGVCGCVNDVDCSGAMLCVNAVCCETYRTPCSTVADCCPSPVEGGTIVCYGNTTCCAPSGSRCDGNDYLCCSASCVNNVCQ